MTAVQIADLDRDSDSELVAYLLACLVEAALLASCLDATTVPRTASAGDWACHRLLTNLKSARLIHSLCSE